MHHNRGSAQPTEVQMNILEVARNRQSSLVLEPLTGSQFMVWGFRGCTGFGPIAGPKFKHKGWEKYYLGFRDAGKESTAQD